MKYLKYVDITRAIFPDQPPYQWTENTSSLIKPPRTFFVNYPLDHTTGKPFDRENQTAILKRKGWRDR